MVYLCYFPTGKMLDDRQGVCTCRPGACNPLVVNFCELQRYTASLVRSLPLRIRTQIQGCGAGCVLIRKAVPFAGVYLSPTSGVNCNHSLTVEKVKRITWGRPLEVQWKVEPGDSGPSFNRQGLTQGFLFGHIRA